MLMIENVRKNQQGEETKTTAAYDKK